MYGYKVPHNFEQAERLDKKNGNTKWVDATNLELAQINQYNTFETFEDIGVGTHPGEEYKNIKVHFVYAVKHEDT